MIQETFGDPTLSGVGVGSERAVGDVLSTEGDRLLVHGGAFGMASLERVVVLRWKAGALESLPTAILVSRIRGKA
jgi:hypothetical protein